LFVESEATSATTRQYAPQQPANPYDAPYQSQLAQARFAPENRFSDQTPDTSRLYHDPMAQNYPNYPANYQQAVAKQSGALKWILITLICVVLVSGAISAMVISAIRARQEAGDAAEAPGAPAHPGAPAPPAPPPAPPASIRGAGLDQYKYPNAKVENKVSGFGSEVMEMTTSDSVDEVSDYYKKRLGDPMVEGDDRAVVFQIPGPPMTLITINQDEKDSDKTEIKVVRTNLPIPKMN
jgi:hypothetical protein